MEHRKRVIAVTGTIGAGKSYVCRLIEQQGISVYDCDEAAKRIMRQNSEIKTALQRLVGEHVYVDGKPDKAALAKFLLTSESAKQAINDIVHPAVAADFLSTPQEWIESAILFESHFDKRIQPDHVVCVTAPREVRINRIVQRDGIDRTRAMQWIDRQMPQEEMAGLSNYEIINDGKADLRQQVANLLEQLMPKP